jgi:hypothetical protein
MHIKSKFREIDFCFQQNSAEQRKGQGQDQSAAQIGGHFSYKVERGSSPIPPTPSLSAPPPHRNPAHLGKNKDRRDIMDQD